MTREEIERIVSVWQERLGLSHWDIKVNWKVSVERDGDAEIRCAEDYPQASIRFQHNQYDEPDPENNFPAQDSYEKWDAKKANIIIVHELLHCFEKGPRNVAEAMGNALPKQAYEVMWAWYTHEAEGWVDALALRFVELAGLA